MMMLIMIFIGLMIALIIKQETWILKLEGKVNFLIDDRLGTSKVRRVWNE